MNMKMVLPKLKTLYLKFKITKKKNSQSFVKALKQKVFP